MIIKFARFWIIEPFLQGIGQVDSSAVWYDRLSKVNKKKKNSRRPKKYELEVVLWAKVLRSPLSLYFRISREKYKLKQLFTSESYVL